MVGMLRSKAAELLPGPPCTSAPRMLLLAGAMLVLLGWSFSVKEPLIGTGLGNYLPATNFRESHSLTLFSRNSEGSLRPQKPLRKEDYFKELRLKAVILQKL